MTNDVIDNDIWNYSTVKLPKAPPVKIGDLHGVLPFDGVRNPGSRSATSHTVWLTYKTPANSWKPKVGICESAAEAAVALEALMSPDTNDIRFQPHTVEFQLDGKRRRYTHDLLVVSKSGHRRLVFVRNEESLSKPKLGAKLLPLGRLLLQTQPTT